MSTDTQPPTSASGAKPSPLADWVEVFRAGRQVPTSGDPIQFTRTDLDQMIANHQLGAAPCVLGHPKGDAPAYAWVSDYRRDGDRLFAKFKDINPAFEAGVQTGAYRNRSLSVFKDPARGWRVNHVGWLGASPPAIDGLQPLQFAAAPADCLTFAAPGRPALWGLEQAAALLSKLRDWVISKDGVETADNTLPRWQIDSISDAAASARTEYLAEEADTPAPAALFAAPQRAPIPPTDSPTDPTTPKGLSMSDDEKVALAAAREAQAAAEARLAEFSRTNQSQAEELARLQRERQAERLGVQVEALVKAGKVAPAQRAGLVEFMASLEAAPQEFTFSRGEGAAEGRKTPATWFAEFLASLPAQVKLGVPADGGDPGHVSGDPADIARRAQEFMSARAASGVTVPIHEAIAHVTKTAGAPQ